MRGFHQPVLLDAVIEGLNCREEAGTYIDCNLGDGGHSQAILAANPANKVIGIDRDEKALERAAERLKPFARRISLVEDNFKNLENILTEFNVKQVKGILFDLGFSSFQIADSGRGFSFKYDAPLDMRMSQTGKVTAADLVNKLSVQELREIIGRFGEERYAGRIASAIVRNRAEEPIEGTWRLVGIIEKTVPPAYRYKSRIHCATRTFQALRIAVNDELSSLEYALPAAVYALSARGRLAIISFHSLEDRMVKAFFRKMSAACFCPPRVPVCVCNTQPTLKVVTSKPIVPTEKEIELNPRSRSSKLRIAEKLGG